MVERYGLGAKGTEVVAALGKRRADFSDEELARYGDYCINDVELTHRLFGEMGKDFPKQELRVIDQTLRMFTEPTLKLNLDMLEQHLVDIKKTKEDLLASTGVDKTELMSNEKFAELLRSFGVEPPMKTSPATGNPAYAFAKTDEDFKALAEHDDVRVQALVAARLGTKSTLEETRTQRFIDIAKRGSLPVPIRYYAAHTGRFGGDDKINMQNLPSRGTNGNKLKKAIIAPEGYTIIDADSAQIEARVLAWLAEQEDLVVAFAEGKDVYKKMASAIYGKPEYEINKEERFVGKTTILGAGYGMGAVKFQAQLKGMGAAVDTDEAKRIIDIYRRTNDAVVRLWRQAQNALVNMSRGEPAPLGLPGLLKTWLSG
jgi:DNA polymerase